MVNFYYGKHRQNAQTKDKRPVSLGKSEADHKIRKKNQAYQFKTGHRPRHGSSKLGSTLIIQ